MSNFVVGRPSANEHAPYYSLYIDRINDDDIVTVLEKQLSSVLATLDIAIERNSNAPYEEGKWTVKQLIGHINDCERVMSYRALRFARNDLTPLSGFEQDDYIPTGNFDARSWQELRTEFEHIRQATIDLFHPLEKDAWHRSGKANDNEISVRALAYVIAGHVAHHINILETRYLNLG
ncbi:MAG: DinB family protein [Blastocatellia bacterium]|nr:DinB family protein [Blastocatellia bacterium]